MAADWDLMEEIYSFARERAADRVWHAEQHHLEQRKVDLAKSNLRVLQRYYFEAKQDGSNRAIAAAIDVFRKHAMEDMNHPDYQSIWTLPKK